MINYPKKKQVVKKTIISLKKEDEVVDFVQFKAQYYPNRPNHSKYMIRINGGSMGAPDINSLVEKVCKKLEIPTSKKLIKKRITNADKKILINLSKQRVKSLIDFCEGRIEEDVLTDDLYTVRIKELSIREKYQPL